MHLVGNPFAATIAARESAQVICRRDAVVAYRDTLYHRVASPSNDYGRSSPGFVQRSGQHDSRLARGGPPNELQAIAHVDRGGEDSRRTSSIQNPGVDPWV